MRQLPTNERLAAYKAGRPGPGPGRAAVPVRALHDDQLLAARRLAGQPAGPVEPQQPARPGGATTTRDVNVQMNYWFVGSRPICPSASMPLAEWVYSIRDVRRDETKAAFSTRGWITHAENGVFGGSTWKWSKGDAAWVAQNLWDHYAFTQDEGVPADAGLPDHQGTVRVLGGPPEGASRRDAGFARRLLARARPARRRRLVRPAAGLGSVHQLHRGVGGAGRGRAVPRQGRLDARSGCWARRSASGASCRSGWSIATIPRTSTATCRT